VLLLSGADSRWLVAVGAIPLAVGYAVSAPALGAAIADLSDDAGRNVGLALTVQGIALAVGPALTGLLVADGAAPAMRVAAGMWLGAALVAAVPLRRPRSRVLALGRDDG
jgi:MFS family permease